MPGTVQGTGNIVLGETHMASCLYCNQSNLKTFLEVGELGGPQLNDRTSVLHVLSHFVLSTILYTFIYFFISHFIG